jgi:hypothetical protein
MLLAAEDVDGIGVALELGSVAAVLAWENFWAAPSGAAVRRFGRQLSGQPPDPDPRASAGHRVGRGYRDAWSSRCWVDVDLAGEV